MSLSLENDIRTYLNEGHPTSFIAELIYEKMNSSDYEWSDTNLTIFCLFLNKVGRPDLILYFISKNITDTNLEIPVVFFINAIIRSFSIVEPNIIKHLRSFLDESPNRWLLASTSRLADSLFPELKKYRDELKIWNKKKIEKLKKDLIQKFEIFVSQSLLEPARQTVLKLERSFPDDSEIALVTQKFKEKNIYNVIEKHKEKKSRLVIAESIDRDVQKAEVNLSGFVKSNLNQWKGFESDLIILAMSMGLKDLELAIVNEMTINKNNIWLYIEVLFDNKRYLDILAALPTIEKLLSNDPDTFIACTFIRAQALWNLGEKSTAIQVLRAVVDIKPNYRNSDVLLAEWSRS